MVKPEPTAAAAANQFHSTIVLSPAASAKGVAATLPSRRAIAIMDPNLDPCLQTLHIPMPVFVQTRPGASPSRT